MHVRLRSGRSLDIPARDSVFSPVGPCRDGDEIDPATVEFEKDTAGFAVRNGRRLIVDNRVETVEAVTVG